MPINKQIELEFRGSNSEMTSEAMRIAVQSQQVRMKNKMRAFHCEVLEGTSTKSRGSFISFLESLQKKESLRTQFIYSTLDHWSCGDIYINEGDVKFFLFDAANSLPCILLATIEIFKYHPHATVYYAGPSVQKTTDECAYFALDNALALSKCKELYGELAKVNTRGPVGPFKSFSDYITNTYLQYPDIFSHVPMDGMLEVRDRINYLSLNVLPSKLGGLLKNMQSFDTYNRAVRPRNFFLNNGKTLSSYLEKHTKEVDGNIQLRGMDYKKAKIKKIALEYINEQQKTVEERSESSSAHISRLPNFFTIHYPQNTTISEQLEANVIKPSEDGSSQTNSR